MIDNRRASNFQLGRRKIGRRKGHTERGGRGRGRGHLETLIWRMVVLGVSRT